MSEYTKVVIEAAEGGRLSINVEDDEGAGHGYRLAGPKYGGHDWKVLARCELDAERVREIRSYLAIWDEIAARSEKGEDGAAQ